MTQKRLVSLVATPVGITLESENGSLENVLADHGGMTLYVHANAAGIPTASCAPDCTSDRLPAIAPHGAAVVEGWTLRQSEAGAQWVYHDAALYRFANDLLIGDMNGKTDAWHVATFRPESDVRLRSGIGVRQIDDAGGTVLVDAAGRTLYAFSGDSKVTLAGKWIPIVAPALASASEQLTVIDRADGIAQWAFHGLPLYRYEDDTKPLDVYGLGVDEQVAAALVHRFFRPANVAIRRVVPFGHIFTTVEGATLYQRDRVSTTNEGHDFREDHGSPALGRAFGAATCNAACTETWQPLIAPPGALASGYWSVVPRSGTTYQWAYKGFAVYTYVHDTVGSALGNAIYELAPTTITPSEPGTTRSNSGSRDDGLPIQGVPQRVGGGISALFWHAVVP